MKFGVLEQIYHGLRGYLMQTKTKQTNKKKQKINKQTNKP